ncbi:aldo/keto reductase [Canibacter oris]|uniref:2,5-diketo-D-gluconate reductase A n=1 Tax=Canibacter oris TaxID=1365628 RepID=A0A840DPA5_9MICO|nr:aldo/keto reductase [Canibacter oris]MBB4071858.1 2,5-diketo-D-gluconate reductase A [Canibacter oris]
MTIPVLRFNDGNEIPQLGYGVWRVPNDVVAEVVDVALKTGFRHIDTARIYDNESGTGAAIAASDVPREEIFVTTKLWNDDQGYDSAFVAFDKSLEKLGLEYLDLYLIHWAKPQAGKYLESWKALIELQRSGRVKSIGVSNFPAAELEEIIAETGVVPAIHQIELHPYWNQAELRQLHQKHGILTQAWSPLGQGGEVLQDPVIVKIAAAHGATPAQVIIAWHLALGNVVIPKSVTPQRIAENFAAAKLQLSAEEVAEITALSKADGRIGPDPADIDF